MTGMALHTNWADSLHELIARASTDLPRDIEAALHDARRQEEPGSNATRALDMMLENVDLARRKRQPLCQDTGALLFWVQAPAAVCNVFE